MKLGLHYMLLGHACKKGVATIAFQKDAFKARRPLTLYFE